MSTPPMSTPPMSMPPMSTPRPMPVSTVEDHFSVQVEDEENAPTEREYESLPNTNPFH